MAKQSRKEVKLESTEKQLVMIKKLLLSFIVLLIASITYILFANLLIDNFDEQVTDKKDLPKITSLDLGSHIVTINGVKSPSLDIVMSLDIPAKVVLDIKGENFFERIDNFGVKDYHKLNFFLPNELIGSNLNLTFRVYDSLSRMEKYERNYEIPVLMSSVTLV